MSEISLQSDDTFVKSIDNSISNVKSSTSTVTTTAESDKSTKKVPQNTFNIWGDAKQLPKLSHSNKVKLKIRKETHDIATTMLKKHKDTLEKTQFIVEEIKKIIETSEPENQINEFIHKEFDEEPLKGLTLCNDPDKIINDIEKSHKFYNNYGYFFNKEGKRIKLYLQTNFGFYYAFSNCADDDLIDTYDTDLINLVNYKLYPDDERFDYFTELKLKIVNACEKGYFYLMKQSLSGENQYEKILENNKKEE